MSEVSTSIQQRQERFPITRIERMVREFYARAQEDELIGPVFERRIAAWPAHLDRMVLFWRAVLRGEQTFSASPRGAPPALHRAIAELDRSHYRRWLLLFAEVVDSVFDAAEAAEVKRVANRIAASLSSHLLPSSIVVLAPRHKA